MEVASHQSFCASSTGTSTRDVYTGPPLWEVKEVYPLQNCDALGYLFLTCLHGLPLSIQTLLLTKGPLGSEENHIYRA